MGRCGSWRAALPASQSVGITAQRAARPWRRFWTVRARRDARAVGEATAAGTSVGVIAGSAAGRSGMGTGIGAAASCLRCGPLRRHAAVRAAAAGGRRYHDRVG
ncbi:MAG: hypothetical protein EHM65_04660 [Acidobacteriales bacterium]|nr:MAG: hypothetical protein EHM65_04660 [Terriglobales bacterium]